MQQPNLLAIPFAKNAGASTKNEIPDSPGPTLAPQQATWEQGFPIITMQPPTIGGIPPQGGDFNGVLNALSEHTVYQNSGGMYKFSAELAASIGGYSKGAILISDDGETLYRSRVDGNFVNPNLSGVGAEWANAAGDASLRQDLANPSEGAALVAFVQEGDGAIAATNVQAAIIELNDKKQPKGDYQPAGNYQPALGYTPVNKAGDTGLGSMQMVAGGDIHSSSWGGWLSAALNSKTSTAGLPAVLANLPTGGVGTLGLMMADSTAGQTGPGATASGAHLRWSSAAGQDWGTPAGTWRCLGGSSGVFNQSSSVTLWQRIA